MNKITITVNADQVKSHIVEREYTNKEGEVKKVREFKLDVVPLKAEKFVTQGEGWKLFKTHFVAIPQTKEQREAKEDTVFVGDGVAFRREEERVEAQLENELDTMAF